MPTPRSLERAEWVWAVATPPAGRLLLSPLWQAAGPSSRYDAHLWCTWENALVAAISAERRCFWNGSGRREAQVMGLVRLLGPWAWQWY